MFDKKLEIPLYIQIYNELKDRIDKGIYKPNEVMPPESEFVKEFNVTRITVRNALKKLQEENLIITIKGVGSKVVRKNKIEQSLFRFYSFGRNYQDKQKEAFTTLIEFSKEINRDINKIFNLFDEEEVYVIKRIRNLDSEPLILEYSYIPTKIVTNLEHFNFENNSIYDILENDYHLVITHAKEYLEPFILNEAMAKLLRVPNLSPVFKTERTTYTNNEIPIEYRVSYIRGDKFRFYADLQL